METPFDTILKNIRDAGYHNHRLNSHSNLLSEQIVKDLEKSCEAFAKDRQNGTLREWHNTPGPD